MSEIKPFGRHIFLTGNVQVGKSTIIRKLLLANPQYNPGGFFTKWLNKNSVHEAGLYMMPASVSLMEKAEEVITANKENESVDLSAFANEKKQLIASFKSDNYKKKIIFPGVFDTFGVSLVENCENADIILMDEIGVFEDRSQAFIDAVLKALDGSTQIIGVVRAKNGVLTNAIRKHPNVDVVEVSAKNRNNVFERLLERMNV